ncbi:glycoside hydrolase family 65 protein [Psittacicella gerlachiana]|uniref:Family 65 glycosyl hydrolase n=1 Tax=Psittacicella gerlachiana TaxID=2028574 RepID=A0A3A1YHK7_9GAMM|nr:glycoside hydrolase family 65 protein [Psittacicella gerlachiana]RIY36729.1 family 65 glycosyl hydrolase [Psittacicella gerlachiana]
MTFRSMEVHPWTLTTHQLDKEHKRLVESLTSLGNGYMGMRGNFEETYSGDTHLGTYVAGVWFPDKTRVGWWKNGYPRYFGKAINNLNFAKVEILVDGKLVDLAKDQVEEFNLTLDMKHGVLSRSFVVAGVKFVVTRFISLAVKELAAFKWEVVSVDGKEHQVEFKSYLDGNVRNEDSNYEENFWHTLEAKTQGEGSSLTIQTRENPFGVERFIVHAEQTFAGDFKPLASQAQESQVVNTFVATLGEQALTFEKRVVLTTSRDYQNQGELEQAASALSQELADQTFTQLLQAHSAKWEERWQLADVQINGSNPKALESQQGIRFNLFQLFSTYYGEDSRLNIGPKGFTGEKYGGATYWDTEAYLVPLYLALAKPEVTENLLKYRHQQLAGAQHNAREQGLAGALYPMVTFNGIECHNEWEITFEEIHRNGAIAYAIYNYTNYTGDQTYLATKGLEVLVEIARFWASRVHYSARKHKYMIHGVTGPNEYENNINNNWYTNRIATWVLDYTAKALAQYPRPDLGVTEVELEKWQDIVANMYFPYDQELEVFVQHDGFLDKELRPVSSLDASKDLPLNQKWSWDKILRSPFIKQADVLQGLYFFGDQFDLETKRRNFDFYEPMTVHESSLSPSIHAILAAELGKDAKAVEMYLRTSRLDLDNYNNDTEDGLHITSMSGSWLSIVQGFAQMKTWQGKLSFAPMLPSIWDDYSFHINYRQRLLKVSINKEFVTLELLQGESLTLEVYGQTHTLESLVQVKLGAK